MMEVADIRSIGVLGSGTMGSGIAQVASQSGYDVILYDITDEIVQRSKERFVALLGRLADKGKLSVEEADAVVGRVATTSDLGRMRDAQVIIEAAPEQLELKQKLFAELERSVPADTVLATNTSTLSITQIASMVAVPERVIGMHFFNPAAIMPLVEVIHSPSTAPEVVETVVQLAEAFGKRAVRVRDVPGFIVNRVARPFHLEALRLLEAGVADPVTIDRLTREGGQFRMGPFELQDLIGIDINYAASLSVYDAYHQAPRFRPSARQRQQVDSGRLGRKSGRGWYEYD